MSIIDVYNYIKTGDVEAIDELLKNSNVNINQFDEQGVTLLMWATISKNLTIVTILLQYGADPNLRYVYYHKTPLMLASSIGCVDIVKVLLDNDADPNLRDYEGNTSLLFATRYKYLDVVEVLLQYADKDLSDSLGDTAVMIAVSQTNLNILRLSNI